MGPRIFVLPILTPMIESYSRIARCRVGGKRKGFAKDNELGKPDTLRCRLCGLVSLGEVGFQSGQQTPGLGGIWRIRRHFQEQVELFGRLHIGSFSGKQIPQQ